MEEIVQSERTRHIHISDHEELAVSFVDATHQLGTLMKKRKKDSKCLSIVADHLAEMFRGGKDLELLEELVKATKQSLAAKMGIDEEDEENESVAVSVEQHLIVNESTVLEVDQIKESEKANGNDIEKENKEVHSPQL